MNMPNEYGIIEDDDLDEENYVLDDYILNNTLEEYDVESLQREIDKSQGIVDSGTFITTNGTLETKLDNAISRELHSKKNRNEISKLSSKQLKAIELSINGVTQNGIARAIGVSKSTVSAWFKNDAFTDMLEKVQKEQIKMFKNHFISQVPNAVRELDKIIRNPQTKDENKLRAINMVLEYAGVKDGIKENTNINTVAQIVVNMNPPEEKKEIISDDKDIIDVDFVEKND